MAKKAFMIEAQMMPPRLKVDGSMTLHFATAEMSPQETQELLTYKMQPGWVLFSPNKIDPTEIPKDDAEMEGKSPSKILYNRMLRYYMTEIDKDGVGFNAWRAKQMLQIGQRYLDKLA